jgi:NADPH-dependent curcumin reductase CurA
MTVSAQRFVLASHPVGEPTQDDFRLETLELPEPQPG